VGCFPSDLRLLSDVHATENESRTAKWQNSIGEGSERLTRTNDFFSELPGQDTSAKRLNTEERDFLGWNFWLHAALFAVADLSWHDPIS
jgi:hypothetical protein